MDTDGMIAQGGGGNENQYDDQEEKSNGGGDDDYESLDSNDMSRMLPWNRPGSPTIRAPLDYEAWLAHGRPHQGWANAHPLRMPPQRQRPPVIDGLNDADYFQRPDDGNENDSTATMRPLAPTSTFERVEAQNWVNRNQLRQQHPLTLAVQRLEDDQGTVSYGSDRYAVSRRVRQLERDTTALQRRAEEAEHRANRAIGRENAATNTAIRLMERLRIVHALVRDRRDYNRREYSNTFEMSMRDADDIGRICVDFDDDIADLRLAFPTPDELPNAEAEDGGMWND